MFQNANIVFLSDTLFQGFLVLFEINLGLVGKGLSEALREEVDQVPNLGVGVHVFG